MRPLFVAALVGAVACSSAGETSAPSGPLARAFASSAQKNGVSADVMMAIAQVEGGLTMPRTRVVEPDAAVPVAGPMELRHGKLDTLARGAALMQTTELALRQDSDLALEAGARVLSEVGARLGAHADDLASYKDALEEMSGYADAAHREAYAHRVFALLARGGTFAARDGETIVIAPHDLPPTLTLSLDESARIQSGPPDYGPAEWFETPSANKWTPGRTTPIDRIVIHDTEGGWDASVATLQNDPGKSVHYIVGQDGRVGQFVHESDTAWHAGNWFYNQHSVGIEHVGYYNQDYPTIQYDTSAKLVDYLTGKYTIAKNRTNIIGHDQIPNGNVMSESSPPCESSPATCETGSSYGGADNHRDPGDWQWAIYMQKVGGTAKCDDIWPLWNCSSDHTQAFRCSNGKIEIENCNGPGMCESQPNGVDDICHMGAPPPADAGPPPADGGDAGAPPPPHGDAGNPGPAPSNNPAPAPSDNGDNGSMGGGASDASSSSGCSAAPAGASAPSGVALLGVVFALALGRRRGTRRHAPSCTLARDEAAR